MNEELLLIARALDDGRVELRAPAVGWWTGAPQRGEPLAPGHAAGTLIVLGGRITLRVPDGACGAVVSDPPELRRAPVGYGDRLLLIDPSASPAHATGSAAVAADSTAPALRATQSGRFWRRAEPGSPPFVEEGGSLEDGRTFGLLEVMKTFQALKYRSGGSLPARALLLRWLAEDGAEVDEGQALAEIGE